jgi:hypothetical protein
VFYYIVYIFSLPFCRLFDRTLARRSHLFFRVELSYQATIAAGTVVSVSGAGTKAKPWVATIVVGCTSGIMIGMNLTASGNAGSIYNGSPESVVVTSVVPDKSITYQVTGGTSGDIPFSVQIPVAGSVTNICGFFDDPLPVVKYSLSSGSS